PGEGGNKAEAGSASSYDVITYNNELYFVSAISDNLEVKKLSDGGQWATIAAANIDSISPKLAIAQGNLYVVTRPASGKGIKAYEIKDGQLSEEGLTVDSNVNAQNYSMITSGSTLLIGYTDYDNNKAVIKEKPISNALLSLTITPPTKVSYTVGEEMSLDGLVVTANYQNGTRELKEGEYTVTGFGTEENGKLIARTTGEQTATVTMKSDTSISNTFTYLVSEVPSTAKITSVTDGENNATTAFTYGDTVKVTISTTGAVGKSAALYYRAADGTATRLTDPVTITEDPSAATADSVSETLSYDTTQKKLPVGEELKVDVCFVEGDNISSYPASTEISLAKKTLTASISGSCDKTYDGTTAAPSTAKLQLSGAVNQEATLSGTIVYESAAASAKAKLIVEDYLVTYADGAAGYYESPTAPTAEGTISKAAVSGVTGKSLTVENNKAHTYTYDLTWLLPPLTGSQQWGDLTYELTPVSLGNYYNEGAKIENGSLILPIQSVSSREEKEIGTIKIKVTSANFNDFTAALTVSSSNRKIPEVEVTTAATLTYGQRLSELTINYTAVDSDTKKEVAGNIAWTDAGAIPDAGTSTAEWRFVPDDSMYAEVTGRATISVAPKKVTAALNMTGTAEKTYDGTTKLPDGVQITIGKVDGILDKDKDNVSVSDQFTAAYEKADAGTKKIRVSGLTLTGTESALKNYTLEASAELTVETGITQAAPQQSGNISVSGNLEAGKPLSGITLSGAFTGVDGNNLAGTLSWKNPGTTYEAGTHKAEWVFTPKSANYTSVGGSIRITVAGVQTPEDPDPEEKTLEVTVSVQGSLTYGQTLNELPLTAAAADSVSKEPVEGTITWTDGTNRPDAGSYDAAWSFVPNNSVYKTVTGTTAIQVNPKAVTVTLNMTGTAKTYDGTATLPEGAQITIAGTEGILSGDNVTAGGQLTAVYADANAGTKTIIVSGLSLSGADSANYKLEPTAELTVEPGITQATPQLLGSISAGKLAAGQPLSSISLSGSFVGAGGESVTGTLSWKNPNTTYEAGTHTAQWIFTPASANYIPVDGNVEITAEGTQTPEDPDPEEKTLEVTVSAQGSLTYGQTLNELPLTAAAADSVSKEPVEGAITWTDGSAVPNAGSHQAAWSFVPRDSSYKAVTGTTAIYVTPRSVTAALHMEGSAEKTYDGTRSLPNGAVITIVGAEGVLPGDNVSAGGQLTAVYADANAGTKTIIVSGLTLMGDASAVQNYELKPTAELTVENGIAPAQPKLLGDINVGKLEAGKPLSSITVSGSFAGVDGAILDGTLSWKNPSATFEAGTHTAGWVFTPKSANYISVEGDTEIIAEKKDGPSADDPSVDDPSVDDPSVDDPSVDDPSTDQPVVPPITDPSETDPTEGKDEPDIVAPDENKQPSEGEAPSTDATDTDAVNTGDETEPAKFALLLALSLLSMGICLYTIRRVKIEK
ncbi:MAG TPA: bacterial Ig-like domain-containing protein, partial [Candidatus Egerieimonas intestinavium]|nr:bacterial Ig-like domain-containing protein [Candidatus Egerieimonas intestinavium]